MPYGSVSLHWSLGLISENLETREPAPSQSYMRINVGDVGFIRRGQFHLLFSAGCPLGERQPGVDVPLTFEELNIGTLATGQPRRPGCLHTPNVQQVGAGLDATGFTTLYVPSLWSSFLLLNDASTRLLEHGVNFSFELAGNRGAALVTRYPTYCEDSLLDSAFETYTVRHYQSWVEFAHHMQYGSNVQPVLISGVDMTRDFAMVSYSNKGTSHEPRPTIAVPMFASASTSFRGTWRTRCLVHTNDGPQQSGPFPRERARYTPPLRQGDTGSIANDSIHCVFARYYTMRSRGPLALFPKVITAGAGPHNLGPGDNIRDTFPELSVQSYAEATMSSSEDIGEQGGDTVIQNTSYVHFSLYPFISSLNFAFRMRNIAPGTSLQIMYSR